MDRVRGQTIAAVAITFIGLLLMTYMITVEDEPGAIPLFLVVFGLGWLVLTRVRARSATRQGG